MENQPDIAPAARPSFTLTHQGTTPKYIHERIAGAFNSRPQDISLSALQTFLGTQDLILNRAIPALGENPSVVLAPLNSIMNSVATLNAQPITCTAPQGLELTKELVTKTYKATMAVCHAIGMDIDKTTLGFNNLAPEFQLSPQEQTQARAEVKTLFTEATPEASRLTLLPPVGAFEPFKIIFRDATNATDPTSLDNTAQARAILDETRRLHNLGYQKVGITYSANRQESLRIRNAYAANAWQVNINGANQAQVMMEVATLLATPEYSNLQQVFRILPITTLDREIDDIDAMGLAGLPANYFAHDQAFINQHLANSGAVLGWQNQGSSPTHPFAVGGGVINDPANPIPAHQKMNAEQLAAAQTYLTGLQQNIPAPPADLNGPQPLLVRAAMGNAAVNLSQLYRALSHPHMQTIVNNELILRASPYRIHAPVTPGAPIQLKHQTDATRVIDIQPDGTMQGSGLPLQGSDNKVLEDYKAMMITLCASEAFPQGPVPLVLERSGNFTPADILVFDTLKASLKTQLEAWMTATYPQHMNRFTFDGNPLNAPAPAAAVVPPVVAPPGGVVPPPPGGPNDNNNGNPPGGPNLAGPVVGPPEYQPPGPGGAALNPAAPNTFGAAPVQYDPNNTNNRNRP